MTEEVWDRILTTNLKSVMFACKHALPVMRAQRSGVIINISSIAAVCSVGIVAYKTSKAAVNAFTQSLAIGNGEVQHPRQRDHAGADEYADGDRGLRRGRTGPSRN